MENNDLNVTIEMFNGTIEKIKVFKEKKDAENEYQRFIMDNFHGDEKEYQMNLESLDPEHEMYLFESRVS